MLETSARLTVDLAALKTNYGVLKTLRHSTEIAGVVKADAYGLGVERVAPALAEAGCRIFFTALTKEAIDLAELFQGGQQKVCVLNGPAPHEVDLFHKHNLIPVLNTLDQIALWQWQGKGTPCILHVDTGMNRLGLSAEEVQVLMKNETFRENLNVTFIMSHFANGATPDSQMNQQQARNFARTMEQLSAFFPTAQESISASAGLFLPFPIEEDLARPGVSLYGIGPQDEPEYILKTVATLEAPVLQIRNIEKGQPVGYGGTFTAERPTKVATLGIGYGDGFSRQFGNNASVFMGGSFCPIIGAVSMDLTTIDITDCKEEVSVGQMAEIFGPNQPVEVLAGQVGKIAYEMIVTLGPRVERLYTE
jgi:alanine racemase